MKLPAIVMIASSGWSLVGAQGYAPSLERSRVNAAALKQYEEVLSRASTLRPKETPFVTISPFTWQSMAEDDRAGALQVMRELDNDKSLNPSSKAARWANIAAKADNAAIQRESKVQSFVPWTIPTKVIQNSVTNKSWNEMLKVSSLDKYLTLDQAAELATAQVELASKRRDLMWTTYAPPSLKDPVVEYGPNPDWFKIVKPGTAAPAAPGAPKPSDEERVRSALLASMPPKCREMENRNLPQCKVSDADTSRASHLMLFALDGGRQDDPFNPVGFMEVVKLQHRERGLNCSGTLVSKDLVLTAKHCVDGYDVPKLFVMIPRWDEIEFAKCGRELGTSGQYRQCVAFDDVDVVQVRVHGNADVALLKLKNPTDNPVAKVDLENSINYPQKISMAGYGENGYKRNLAQKNALEVGWYSGKFTFETGFIAWTFEPEKKTSATCNGDSGGPIFSGRHEGYNKDVRPREVLAITTKADREECKAHVSLQTIMRQANVRNWLCDQPDFPKRRGDPKGCDSTFTATTRFNSIDFKLLPK